MTYVHRSKWALDFSLVTLAMFAGVVTAQARAGFLEVGSPADCAYTGCIECNPDNCHKEPGEFLMFDGPEEQVTRCVEYDQIPPAHCATMMRQPINICKWVAWPIYPGFEVVGACYWTYCSSGTPTSTVCDHPWVRPSPPPDL